MNTETNAATLAAPKITPEFGELRDHVAKIQNDDDRFPGALAISDKMTPAWAQGDVAIVFLGADKPANMVLRVNEKPNRQLAPGETQGSRHCLSSLDGVTMYDRTEEGTTLLDGPIFEATKEFVLEHPEHGNVHLGPGWYGVVYQRAEGAEIERQRD